MSLRLLRVGRLARFLIVGESCGGNREPAWLPNTSSGRRLSAIMDLGDRAFEDLSAAVDLCVTRWREDRALAGMLELLSMHETLGLPKQILLMGRRVTRLFEGHFGSDEGAWLTPLEPRGETDLRMWRFPHTSGANPWWAPEYRRIIGRTIIASFLTGD